ncbi:hypothetical protein FB451DRAFT_149035 [Mycena latifolia]|nr:hypothetical protein FB451DRAFT_149035 [Mycena latifolia]
MRRVWVSAPWRAGRWLMCASSSGVFPNRADYHRSLYYIIRPSPARASQSTHIPPPLSHRCPCPYQQRDDIYSALRRRGVGIPLLLSCSFSLPSPMGRASGNAPSFVPLYLHVVTPLTRYVYLTHHPPRTETETACLPTAYILRRYVAHNTYAHAYILLVLHQPDFWIFFLLCYDIDVLVYRLDSWPADTHNQMKNVLMRFYIAMEAGKVRDDHGLREGSCEKVGAIRERMQLFPCSIFYDREGGGFEVGCRDKVTSLCICFRRCDRRATRWL